MTAQRLRQLPDVELASALRDLGRSIAWPAPGGLSGDADLAAAVRARIETMPAPRARRGPLGLPPRGLGMPWHLTRRAVILALVALLAFAALAGAVGLGLPGLRLILGEAPGSPPPSPSTGHGAGSSESAAPGTSMGLGEPLDATDPAGLDARAGFHVAIPADPAVGPPWAAYIDEGRAGQVTLGWPSGPDLPATLEPSVGLLLGEFEGAVNEGFFVKAVGTGTTLEHVRLNGQAGFWISGEPHVLFWDGPRGPGVDARRWVGDVLIWSNGSITYRLESALGRDEAIRIAESLS